MKKTKNKCLFYIAIYTLCYIFVFLSLIACKNTKSLPPAVSRVYTFVDDTGQKITIAPTKTAVLQGSLANMWLLSGGKIAGATTDVFSLLLTSPFAGDLKDTYNIGSLMNPIIEKIIAQKIDFCIASKNIPSHIAIMPPLEKLGVKTALFYVETFNDYKNVMKIFCNLNARPDLYKKNVEQIEKNINQILQNIPQTKKKPNILLLRAFSTGTKTKTSNNQIGAMLKDLGCHNIADNNSNFLEDLSKENIITADIDFIFIELMGESTTSALKTAHALLQTKPFLSLKAVQQKKVFILDKDLFHYKPCNKWDAAYKYLFDIVFSSQPQP